MMILALVRNYIPSYQWVIKGGWNIADCVARSYDLEGMDVGTVAAGRIGLARLRLLKPFDVKLHYLDRHRLPDAVEKELEPHSPHQSREPDPGLRRRDTQLPAPSGDGAHDQRAVARRIQARRLSRQHRARQVCAIATLSSRRLESGQLAGYAGDVWFPQPPPKDHPWRTMPHHGMTPHISGTSLSAQTRYAAGTREILECYFEGRPIRDEYLIVQGGKLAGVGAHSYSVKK